MSTAPVWSGGSIARGPFGPSAVTAVLVSRAMASLPAVDRAPHRATGRQP
ncbi:hypothetical protein [Promicromonospora aerolata]|uniref:GMC oxidoreductase n=1 Tax=Promicromonospora aerolata TaxID=195749 RepID=A0ABW4V5Q0_9MICO